MRLAKNMRLSVPAHEATSGAAGRDALAGRQDCPRKWTEPATVVSRLQPPEIKDVALTMLASPAQSIVSDEALAECARRGSPRAFDALVSRYQARVFRLAMRMSRNASDAEEITQETFLHAHSGMGSFQAASQFGTWLYRIAINEALMRKRAATRRPTRSLDALEAAETLVQHRSIDGEPPGSNPVPLADDLLERKQLALRVRDAMNRLDVDTRAALVLRDLEELSAEQASEILGISADAVRQRAHRGRLKLRDILYR